MDPINRLIEFFREFPGIGPRQAKRFVYFLLSKPDSYKSEIIQAIKNLKGSIALCSECFRFFIKKNSAEAICDICSGSGRDESLLMVVSRDVDAESIEKSGSFKGKYFVLGGVVPILAENPEKKIRQNELLELLRRQDGRIKEIILALNANIEGDNTAQYLKTILAPIARKQGIAVSTLGRGLSTGTELEYSDKETINNALKNRGEVTSY